MEDRELVNKVIRSGDTKSFSVIVSRYSAMVYAKALGLVRREELAAEITQQTFIKSYQNLEFWSGQSLGPWLSAIAAHTSLNILEKEKRRRAKSIDQIAETEAAAEGNYSEEHENMLSKMEKAMEKLPEDDRRLIELHYYNKLPTKDIANKTGMSQANVLVKLHRIRERLKKIIENEGDE